VDDPDSGSNPSDDHAIDVLEALADDPTFEELTSFINALNDDEQIELVALAWLGRGDYTIDEWEDARRDAAEARTDHTASYLLGIPLLGDYLEEGLAAHKLSCQAFEINRL
ncbi:MAG: DUF3775 domain-containing protein, partial [Alphaproteobacteria bacterium]|nr:DUF3775 domain-containing protein [Alphaproteobacteria bacterium]